MLTRLGLVVLPTLPRWAVLACARSAGAVAYWTAPPTAAHHTFESRCRLRRQSFAQSQADVSRGGPSIRLPWLCSTSSGLHGIGTTGSPICHPRSALRAHVYTQPMIGVTAHFGNWELLSKALSVYGFAHVAVATPLANPMVDAIIGVGRSIPGVEIVTPARRHQGPSARPAPEKTCGTPADQNTKPEEGGLFVSFFGLSIPMSTRRPCCPNERGRR